MTNQTELKKAAALYALDNFIKSGMQVGLGSGSTSELFVEALAARVKQTELRNIVCVATSQKVAELARDGGLQILGLNEVNRLDVTIDGADEIESKTFGLIKGRGGALLREKLVAVASDSMVVIADESKLVAKLGERMPLPIEVIEFGWQHTAQRLKKLDFEPILRLQENGKPYLTDSQNFILDCKCQPLEDAKASAKLIKNIVGVVEHGLFIDIAKRVVIAGRQGVYELPTP